MLSRMENPINGYLLRDKKGNLLPGGRMEFFEDDTDTPANVYDAGTDLSVSLGNTIYADAYGLLPDFELTPNQDYKLLVYDADGAFQWERGGVANNIVNLESRIEDLESAVSALGKDGGPKNLLTNGSCKAVRHASEGAEFPVRSTWALGDLSGIFAQVASATAGTFHRLLDSNFGSTGVCARLDNVTTDSSESQAEIMWRMPSGDGANISGDDVVLQTKIRQNSGSSMNIYLTLYKCLTQDDFGGDLVTIAASSPVAVASNTLTKLELPVPNPGDLSTGVALVVTFDCGIVTNTSMDAGETQLERGLVGTEFENRPQRIDQGAWSDEDLVGVGQLNWYPAATQAVPGTVIADRNLKLRADYPRLWAWAQTYARVVTDAEYLAGDHACYSSGDGSTTFRTPDYVTDEVFVRALNPDNPDRGPGEYQPDAFQGHWHNYNYNNTPVTDDIPGTGAGIHYESTSKTAANRVRDAISDGTNGDPRIADETRPKNVAELPCITY